MFEPARRRVHRQAKALLLFGLFDRDVHVFTERIGGGFGGKQEMISEDCACSPRSRPDVR